MDFHESFQRFLTICGCLLLSETGAVKSDLANCVLNFADPRIGGTEMARMFRRLMRGSGRPHVVGWWQF